MKKFVDSDKKKGFTLIEVLVVVSIVGLLASVVLVGLGGFRARGRDARRVADLKSLQNGLELFYTKKGVYPSGLGDLTTEAGLGITRLPKDPVTSKDYDYSTCATGQSYLLGADLDAAVGDKVYTDSVKSGEISDCGTVSFETKCGNDYFCVSF